METAQAIHRRGAAAQSAGKANARGSANTTPLHPSVPAAAAATISALTRRPSRNKGGDRPGEPEKPGLGERSKIA